MSDLEAVVLVQSVVVVSLLLRIGYELSRIANAIKDIDATVIVETDADDTADTFHLPPSWRRGHN